MNIFQCIEFAENYESFIQKHGGEGSPKKGCPAYLIEDLKKLAIKFSNLGLDSFNIESQPSLSQEAYEECLTLLNKIKISLIRLEPMSTRRNRTFEAAYPYLKFFHLTWIAPIEREDFYWKIFLSNITTSLDAMTYNLVNFKTNWINGTNKTSRVIKKYQNNIQFLMHQGLIPGFGSSNGECYGLSMEYAQYRQTPTTEPFKFTSETAKIQERQAIKNPKNQKLFPKRLGLVHYQPNLIKQAEGLINNALRHQGKPLLCTLFMEKGAHATYLEYTQDGKYHFFDPNHGAFEFNQAEDFKAFYQDLYSNHMPWHSYQVEELLTEPPLKTWIGKLRSFLTGARYDEGFKAQHYLTKAFIGISAAILGIGMSAALIFFWPVTLPTLMIIGVGALASVGAYRAGIMLKEHVEKLGFLGLFALPRFLHHSIFSAIQTITRNTTSNPAEPLPKENSYAKIICALPSKGTLNIKHEVEDHAETEEPLTPLTHQGEENKESTSEDLPDSPKFKT